MIAHVFKLDLQYRGAADWLRIDGSLNLEPQLDAKSVVDEGFTLSCTSI